MWKKNAINIKSYKRRTGKLYNGYSVIYMGAGA